MLTSTVSTMFIFRISATTQVIARAAGFNSSIYDAVEKTAWSYQEENGGIAAQSYLNGTIYGTANVETTSILLLGYYEEAIASFKNILEFPSGELLALFMMTTALVAIVYRRKRQKWCAFAPKTVKSVFGQIWICLMSVIGAVLKE